MEQRYLIDINAIIDAQMGKIPESGMKFMAGVVNREFIVSFVSYIEFMGYKNISPQSEAFISLATVVEIDKNIIKTCISFQKSKRIDLPDAIIVATALTQNLIIVSRNVKDFTQIAGLQVLDPHSLWTYNHQIQINSHAELPVSFEDNPENGVADAKGKKPLTTGRPEMQQKSANPSELADFFVFTSCN